MKAPPAFPNEITPNFSCMVHKRRPRSRPPIAPQREISHPSVRNILRIRALSAPRLCRIRASSFFSIINMERDPITLKEAMSRIKQRIKKVIHFSNLRWVKYPRNNTNFLKVFHTNTFWSVWIRTHSRATNKAIPNTLGQM